MRRSSPFEKLLSLLLCAVLLSQGACTSNTLAALPGWADYLAPSYVPVPGGFVNAAGGNLFVQRSDLSIDTLLGTQTIDASYNSALGSWLWSFQVFYDGEVFVDASGLVLELGALADGAAVPGTSWVRVDADTLETRGGLRHEFDASGRLAAVRWATLDYPRIRYVTAGGGAQLVMQQCTSPTICTPFFEIALRPDGRPEEAVDARTGRTADYEYDAEGRLTRARTAKEVAESLPGTSFEYAGSLLTAITNSEGERIEYTWQGKRTRTVVQIGEGNPTHRFQYGAKDPGHGDLYPTTYTNPLGGEVAMYFDAEQKLHEQEFVATGELRVVEWNSARRIVYERLPNGATTEVEYAGDDPVQITKPSGNVVEITYEPGGLNVSDPHERAIRRIDDSLGFMLENAFDAQGRLVTTQDGAASERSIEYGFSVFPASFTDANALTTTFSLYGVHGHWLKSDGAFADRRRFDPTGNATIGSVNGRTGGFLSQSFDPDRRPVAWHVGSTIAGETDATATIQMTRGSDGRPLEISRPGGGDHRFEYDALGRVVLRSERVDGVWRDTTFGYDLAGNIVAMELPNGMRQELEHDVYGRPLRHRSLRSGVLEAERVLTYRDGSLESSWDSVRGTTETHLYDAAGRLVVTDHGRGDVLTRGYDLRGRLVSETWSVGGQVLASIGYAYDLANRVVAMDDLLTQVALVEVEYDGARPAVLRHGNGLVRTIAYDPANGQAMGAETHDAAGALVERTTITRSTQAGPDRTQVDVRVETPLGETQEIYWLTRSDQFTEPGARVFRWSNDEGDSREFNHDILSNRLDTPQDSFDYNAESNRLLAATVGGEVIAYTYDHAGFVTSRDGVAITWSALGRMTSHGADRAEWDASGRIVELESSGVVRRFDLFGGRLQSDAATGLVGALDLGAVVLHPGTARLDFRHIDFRSNVSFVSDEAGDVVTHYRYSPYGLDAALGADGGTHFVDRPALGPLMLLGARVYDPAVGRFLSPDPVLQPLNQYAYTNGNPVAFMDRSGLVEATTVAIFVGIGTIGAAVAGVGVASWNPPLIAVGLATAGAAAGTLYVLAVIDATLAVADSVPALPSLGGNPTSPRPPPGPGPGEGDDGGGSPDSAGDGWTITITIDPGVVAPPPVTCSPARLSGAPDGSPWFPWLIAINILLACAVGASRMRLELRRQRTPRTRSTTQDLE